MFLFVFVLLVAVSTNVGLVVMFCPVRSNEVESLGTEPIPLLRDNVVGV